MVGLKLLDREARTGTSAAGHHRLFIGMRLPADLSGAVSRWQETLAAGSTGVRWAPRDRLHLTLRFLGDTDPDLEAAIARAMGSAAAAVPELHLALAQPGGFPSLQRPRVLWIGLAGALEPLHRLRATLDGRLETLGIAPDPAPFRPHLTVGRLRRGISPSDRRRLADLAARLPAPAGRWTVREVTLFRSIQDGGAARHVALATAPLGGTTPAPGS